MRDVLCSGCLKGSNITAWGETPGLRNRTPSPFSRPCSAKRVSRPRSRFMAAISCERFTIPGALPLAVMFDPFRVVLSYPAPYPVKRGAG